MNSESAAKQEFSSSKSMIGRDKPVSVCSTDFGQPKSSANAPGGPRRGRLRTMAGLLLGMALLGSGFSIGWRSGGSREGLLSGERFFALRQPYDGDAREGTEQSAVPKEAALSRSRSASRQAQLAKLELHCRSLEADKCILLCQAPEVNPEIRQRIAELGRQKRCAENNLGVVVLEKQHLARETLRDRLTREDTINGLRTQINKAQQERQQARDALELMRENYHRALALRPRSAISESEYADKLNEYKSRQIEVAKLEGQLQDLDRQKSELERAIRDAAEVSEKHDQALSADQAAWERELTEVNAALKKATEERAEDQARASRHHHALLQKLDLELEQAVRERTTLEKEVPT